MDVALRHTICRLIAGLVVSDDDFAPEEEAFIDRLLTRFGVADRESIFPIISHDEAAAQMRALPSDVQDGALRLLAEAAAADGHIADEERAYLKAVSTAMGVGEAALEEMIATAMAARAG